MYSKFSLVIAILLSSLISSAQEILDSDKTENEKMNSQIEPETPNKIGVIRVKDSIFMLKGRGGNIGVSVGEDGVFMIDNQFADASQDIIQRIQALSKKPIKLLVNTHHHADHVGGNVNFALNGTIIFSHENARQKMKDVFEIPARVDHQKKIDSVLSAYGNKITSDEGKKSAYMEAEKKIGSIEEQDNTPFGHLPVVSFSKDLTINYNGEKIMLIYVPRAHTNGDVMIYFTKSNVLHTGDTFVNGSYPFIDTESNGSHEGYVKGLDKILQIVNDDTRIIPGHGDIATINDVRYTRAMYRFLTERVAYHVIDNKTEAEVVAMGELTKEYDDKGFGEGFITTDKFIKSLYDETAKKYRKQK